MEPDPKCHQCHGSGRIELFTSVIACECLFFRHRGDRADTSGRDEHLGLKLSDDAWLDAMNNHGNGD